MVSRAVQLGCQNGVESFALRQASHIYCRQGENRYSVRKPAASGRLKVKNKQLKQLIARLEVSLDKLSRGALTFPPIGHLMTIRNGEAESTLNDKTRAPIAPLLPHPIRISRLFRWQASTRSRHMKRRPAGSEDQHPAHNLLTKAD